MLGVLWIVIKIIGTWAFAWLGVLLLLLLLRSLPLIAGFAIGCWESRRVPKMHELWTDRAAIISRFADEIGPVLLGFTGLTAAVLVFFLATQTAVLWDNWGGGYVSLPGGRPRFLVNRSGPPTTGWLYIARDVHEDPNKPAIEFGARRVLIERQLIQANQPTFTPLVYGDRRLAELQPWPPLLPGSLTSSWKRTQRDRPVIVVFVHGYANTSESAQRGTTAIANAWPHEMSGPSVISYVWKSAGTRGHYDKDEEAIDATTNTLRWFLESLVAANPTAVLAVVAHSMGSRAVFNALLQTTPWQTTLDIPTGDAPVVFAGTPWLQEMYRQWEERRRARRAALVDLAVLIAPDIDAAAFADSFSRHRTVLAAAAKHFLVFGSAHDEVLKMSAAKNNGAVRVGQGPDSIRALGGLTFVDCTDCTALNLGHSYIDAAIRELVNGLTRATPP